MAAVAMRHGPSLVMEEMMFRLEVLLDSSLWNVFLAASEDVHL